MTLIGVPRVAFQFPRTEGLEWLNLTSRLALIGIIFLPHGHRSANTNIMMGLVIHHDLEARGGIYLLVNSAEVAATKLLSKLLAIPTEWSAMDYEQYCSTSQALITGLLEAVRRSVLPESPPEIVRIAHNH